MGDDPVLYKTLVLPGRLDRSRSSRPVRSRDPWLLRGPPGPLGYHPDT
jgi:hypothetical protein